MTALQMTVRSISARTVEFTEVRRTRLVPEACAAVGSRYMRARHRGGWLVPQHRAADVEAYLEARGVILEITL